jgi:hypothetical protein
LGSTVDEVFRRLPSARPVRPIVAANARDAGKALLPAIPRGGSVRVDRGDPSDELIESLTRHDAGYWLFRCPAQSTVPAVEAGVRAGPTAARITLPFSTAQTFTRRAVRLTRPDGTVSVLWTNLSDTPRCSADAMMALYFRRWGVATHYRDENTSLASEPVHRQTENGIRQERVASRIMAGIARRLMRLTTAPEHPAQAEPQFKHALITLANEADLLTPQCPELAFMSFSELLNAIARVRYYRPKTPRSSQPRVSKKPVNTWQVDKAKRMAEA